ncbi:MAG: ABC transporter substrate-binding protein [Bdellovibrionales bacterium]
MVRIVGAILIVAVSALLYFKYMHQKQTHVQELNFDLGLVGPYTVDTYHYDMSINHQAFTPVLSPLVSQYHLGKIEGQIAESWRASDDFKTWIFTIKKNITFENGDVITPQVVVKSLTRMAYLMYQKQSASGFMEDLEDLNSLKFANSEFKGITFDQNSVTLNFIKPKRKLLTLISFGLYGVVHPEDFDARTGEWRNPHKAIASGPYRITEWSETKIKLVRREVNWFYKTENPIDVINLNFLPGPYDFKTNDLFCQHKNSIVMAEQKGAFEFFGPAVSSISYIKIYNWQNPKSIFSNRKFRQFLRTEFYKAIEKIPNRSTQLSRSFFPLSMKNVTRNTDFEFDASTRNALLKLVHGLKIRVPKSSVKVFDAPMSKEKLKAGDEVNYWALKDISSQMNFEFELINHDGKIGDHDIRAEKLDIDFLGTGILVEDPDDDIRFMFLSKEGIGLPDETGEIKKLLNDDPLDVAKINQLLWEQAIIWPNSHASRGMWAKKDLLDFSQLNVALPPVDFQFLGWK